jgi:hypothetical protein
VDDCFVYEILPKFDFSGYAMYEEKSYMLGDSWMLARPKLCGSGAVKY